MCSTNLVSVVHLLFEICYNNCWFPYTVDACLEFEKSIFKGGVKYL